jgi:hypothetical protein
MADQEMTLIERLRNPQWVHGPSPNSDAELDKEQTTKDMQEAAGELERLKLKKRPVAFRLQARNGDWILYDDEEVASVVAEASGLVYQGLYVRDGT